MEVLVSEPTLENYQTKKIHVSNVFSNFFLKDFTIEG